MDSNYNGVCLPKKCYQEVLNEVIKKKLIKSSNDFDIICSPGSSKGDNYLGIVYRIQVMDKGTNNVRLTLIVKLPPENETRRNELLTNEFFVREAVYYNEIYPIYKSFQESKGINVELEGFNHVPLCYKAISENTKEGLFFEDLKVKGFEMFDRLKDVTKEHVILVMKTLAKFHATFYALKDQKPELIRSYFDLPELFIVMSERGSSVIVYFEHVKQQTLDVVNKSSNSLMVEKVKEFLKEDLLVLLKKTFDPENFEPYGCICHGDCWNNNMMFTYGEDKKPSDIRFLDFQIMRNASPVCDLVYYIFGCTTKYLRDEFYGEFLDVYYAELSSYMLRLGSKADTMFPRKVFDQHLKVFGNFGLVMAMMILPLITSNAEDTPDMDEFAENLKKLGENGEVDKNAFDFTSENSYDKYAKRMLEVCEDMCLLQYI